MSLLDPSMSFEVPTVGFSGDKPQAEGSLITSRWKVLRNKHSMMECWSWDHLFPCQKMVDDCEVDDADCLGDLNPFMEVARGARKETLSIELYSPLPSEAVNSRMLIDKRPDVAGMTLAVDDSSTQ